MLGVEWVRLGQEQRRAGLGPVQRREATESGHSGMQNAISGWHLTIFFSFLKIVLLKFGWGTMSLQFLLYREATQPYTFCLFSPYSLPLCSNPRDCTQFPALYSRTALLTDSKWNSLPFIIIAFWKININTSVTFTVYKQLAHLDSSNKGIRFLYVQGADTFQRSKLPRC